MLSLRFWQVAVNKGFTPGASFKATLSGSGDLFLLGLNATDLTLTNNGCARRSVTAVLLLPPVTSCGWHRRASRLQGIGHSS
jgi:hypothetical protein